jgi:hypothetical protein
MISFLGICACVSLLTMSLMLRRHLDKTWPQEGHGSTYFQSSQVHN